MESKRNNEEALCRKTAEGLCCFTLVLAMNWTCECPYLIVKLKKEVNYVVKKIKIRHREHPGFLYNKNNFTIYSQL